MPKAEIIEDWVWIVVFVVSVAGAAFFLDLPPDVRAIHLVYDRF